MANDEFSSADIDLALLRDRHRLRRLWKSIQQPGQNQSADQRREKFHQLIEQSLAAVGHRDNQRPAVTFEQDLPILEHREEIAQTIRDHQVVVVSGETGSGKSTQLPKICLDAGFGTFGLIGHTQPRRIAARTIAARLAEELRQPLGEAVGFKIRFTDKTKDSTLIKLMTDGILLAETQGDRFLEQYEVIVIDEAHERSLNIDFLLGFLHQILPKRPELRVIITSATIDAERFSQHFAGAQGPAPVIEVSGRSYPVEVRYRPQLDDEGDETEQLSRIVSAVHELAEIDSGHILVFLPTERDIRETANRLRKEKLPRSKTEILPLYARLSAAEQNKVFQESKQRRIVLATNVAESSLTVPGIRYVIDTGTVRLSRYSPRSKVQRLPIEAISRASADQRKGRCGRVAPGICIRLFSEDDYLGRSAYTTPEIQRTNLASVILRAKTLNLGRVEDFPFLDPPPPEAIRDGYRTLFELGAVDEQQELSELGRRLSRFPVDPRIARIILSGQEFNCLSEILIIAAALEVQDPRERPHDKQEQADQRHAAFADDRSDFVSYLRLWDFCHQLKEDLSRNALRRACKKNFLSYNRLREWMEIRRQLAQLTAANRLHPGRRKDEYDPIHQALLTGLLSGVAYRSSDFEYTGGGGVKFHLWPGSAAFAARPSWVLVAELVETRRRYGRTVAEIKPSWIEPLAEHILKRQFNDPHWHRKSSRVMAWESVTLFGLPIVTRRRTPYGPINPEVASEVFVREALAKRQLDCTDSFYRHNEQTIEACIQLAAKTRRADYLVDEYTLYQFYNARLPVDVYDLASLRKWLKASADNRRAIRLSLEQLIAEQPQESAQRFPDELVVGSLNLPVEYAFSPGDESDGATITVPQAALAQLDATRAAWGVPGLLEERIVAMIRSLPKTLRRGLIPAPDTAKSVAAKLQFGRGEFLRELTKELSAVAGERIPPDAFRWEKIPQHLSMNIRVVDEEGNLVRQSRNLQQLRSDLRVAAAVAIADVESRWHRDGLTSWDFGELPKEITITRSGIEMSVFPTLVDDGESVQLRLFNSDARSWIESRAGARRLYALQKRQALSSQIGWLPHFDEICVWAAAVISREELAAQVRDLIADRAFFQSRELLPRDEAAFAARLENAAERIGMATQDVAKLLPKLFESYQQARLAIEQYSADKWQFAIADVEHQMTAMLSGKFFVDTPWMWLCEFPRYFQAIAYRLERIASGSLEKDRAATAEIADFWQRYQERSAAHELDQTFDAELTTFRWMLEEYRVSCFAQPLGTIVTVSPQRLEKQWAKVTA